MSNNKQSIKLYTEEQLMKAIQMADKTHYLVERERNEIVNSITPIELPSNSLCINCDESKSTHNVCMDCMIKIGKENIELPSNGEIIPVKALEEDGDWYLIPNELYEEFKNDTYNEEMVESGGFDDKWWKYKTGGDLNLIQLYVKIQGDNK